MRGATRVTGIRNFKTEQRYCELMLASLISAWVQDVSNPTAGCHSRRRYLYSSKAEHAHCEMPLVSSISERIQNRASPLRVATRIDDIRMTPEQEARLELPITSSVSAWVQTASRYKESLRLIVVNGVAVQGIIKTNCCQRRRSTRKH
jgi:hypothetical protein